MSQKIPLHDLLLKVKQNIIIVDSALSRTPLVSGYFLGQKSRYYQLIDVYSAILQVMRIEGDKAYVDLNELSDALLGKVVDLYDLFNTISEQLNKN